MRENGQSRREAVRLALTAAGVDAPQGRGLVSTYELTQGPLALRKFYEEALENSMTEVYAESWPTDETELGAGAWFRDESPWGSAGVFRLDGALALVVLEQGEARVSIAASSREQIDDAAASFRTRFPFAAPPSDDLVPITFWSYGRFGPQSYTRRLAVAPWEQIEGNYTGDVREGLSAIMGEGFEPGKGGQLLLWQGPPGTGKTWALRALASEWREWAEIHYVADPDAFFGEHAGEYMVEVLLREAWEYPDDGETATAPAERWRLLVLEDTGELLSADAKEKSGQALSRLLNVVDGLIGQGLRVLVLVTTNDSIETFHPAVSRPGRCASAIAFAPLTAEEVAERLGVEEAEPATLAELYARQGEAADPSLSDDDPILGGAVKPAAAIPEGDVVEVAIRAAGELAQLADAVEEPPATLAADPALGIGAPEDVRPAPNEEAVVELPEQRTNGSQIRWEGILVVEDTLTEDGRYIKPGATTWRELPLSLAAMLETEEGHTGAQVCGRIDDIWREGNLIMGKGVFDDNDFGREIADMVENRTLRGNSVDLAIREFELAPRSDFDETGHRVSESDAEIDPLDMIFGDGGDEPLVFVFLDCVIGMSTVCPFPAFADASISVLASALAWRSTRQSQFVLTASGQEPETQEEEQVEEPEPAEPQAEDEQEDEEGLTASAAGLAPLKPPREWFDDPQFSELTALTVTDDGRVFGHFAQWDTCHIGIPDVCTTAPSSSAHYAYFHLGEVETEEGDVVACGKITLGTGHAAKHLGRQAATEHYDHTGAVVADVVAGEDEFGPWISGALRPDMAASRVRELRAATLSGDWRNVNGALELVGLLAVNVPGFPVPRSERALVAATESGMRVESLVAAGMVRHDFTKTEQDRLAGLAVVAESGLEGLAALAADAA
jgi:hypothetical protein